MDKDSIIVVTSGFFNPIHRGHIWHLQLAKDLFPNVHHVAIVNNDKQAILKKGFDFVPLIDRLEVVGALRSVDEVFPSIDEDLSVSQSLAAVAKKYAGRRIVFAKGGDRVAGTLPQGETDVCEKYNVEVKYGVGGNPTSSTAIIKKIKKD